MDRYVVDYLNVAFRSFFPVQDLKTSIGVGTGVPYSFLKELFYLMTKYKIKRKQIIISLDSKAQHKKEIYPDYKKGRKKIELEGKMSLDIQLKICKLMMDFLGLTQCRCEGEEADDVCFTLSSYFSKKGIKTTIISSDHDLYQCLNKNTSMLISQKAGEETYTEEKFLNKYNIYPDNYKFVQCLSGCQTDNVKGMKGIGEETAFKIVEANSWDKIIKNSDDLVFPNKRANTAFRKGFSEWNIDMNMKLVKLQNNLKLKIEKNEFNKGKLLRLFKYLEFRRFSQQDCFNRICEVFE